MFPKKLFFSAAILFMFQFASEAQTRFADTTFFKNVSVQRDINYGSAKNIDGNTEQLKMDIYSPQGDQSKGRPLIIWVHGGGFTGGDKNEGTVVEYANAFTKAGYVCASVDYRLGVEKGLSFDEKKFLGLYRGVQDIKSAIRFFKKNATLYNIDTSKIIVGGTSAGALIALQCAYMQQSEADTYNASASKTWGPIEGSSGNAGFSSHFCLVVSCWGALVNVNWMQGEHIPVVCVQGTADETVPYNTDGSLYGSKPITDEANKLGIPYKLLAFPGAGHGLVSGGSQQRSIMIDSSRRVISKFIYTEVISGSNPGAGSSGSSSNNNSGNNSSIGNNSSGTTDNGITNTSNNSTSGNGNVSTDDGSKIFNITKQGKGIYLLEWSNLKVNCIQISDADDKVIKSYNKPTSPFKLNLKNLAPGKYIATMCTEGKNYTRNFEIK